MNSYLKCLTAYSLEHQVYFIICRILRSDTVDIGDGYDD
jgi:hypothetical protein